MMGTIPGDVRGGLLELFYGVYNKCGRRRGGAPPGAGDEWHTSGAAAGHRFVGLGAHRLSAPRPLTPPSPPRRTWNHTDRDAERCLEALVTMGVLVATGDRMAVRRTADVFLTSFQERLDEQRSEREAKGAAAACTAVARSAVLEQRHTSTPMPPPPLARAIAFAARRC